ncbi:MAG TPA: hypothetical protein VMT71_15090 [Syntrophorhabdales bacterium]|nr:hypothetical protein [Syntrophorhabdales bacterium]
MNCGDENGRKPDSLKQGDTEKEKGKLATVAKAFRAVNAIVVFGIPLLAGTAALLGYGVHKAYKRMTRR